jgi:small-conductance mechanosensitive channel
MQLINHCKVRAYFERKALAHSLNDTKTAVQQLHKLASSIVIVIIFVVFLLVMELANSKVVLFVITQLVLLGFAFQNTCKTIFESIIFVFIMHPFDIGDRCVIEGVQVIDLISSPKQKWWSTLKKTS